MSHGKETGTPSSELSLVDRMVAGLMNPREAADQIMSDAYGPLKQFCILPAGFANRKLAWEFRNVEQMSSEQLDALNMHPPSTIIDPAPPQLRAIELLRAYLEGHPICCQNKDPFQPMFGVNFVGPPGCGKTHIMSAAARFMKEFLDGKLKNYRLMIAKFVKEAYTTFQLRSVALERPDDKRTIYSLDDPSSKPNVRDSQPMSSEEREQKLESLINLASTSGIKMKEEKDPTTVLLQAVENFKAALGRLQYQPPDLLYLEFDKLCELCLGSSAIREQALEALIKAKVLFIDDVHPKGNSERLHLVQHIIESRYAAGRMGIFMTTNLSTEDLVGERAKAILSRCQEMICEIEFENCTDWRSKIKSRRIELAKKYIEEKIAPHISRPEQQTPEN